VGVSCMYKLFKLGMLLPCKSLLQIWSIGWEVFGETLSWWTPTRTTTNWPPIILGLPSLFLEMSVCRIMYHGISILICPNMLCNISRFRYSHTLKVEAAAWLEDGSCVYDQCPGEDETYSERSACSFILPRPSSLWAEETFFLSVFTFFEDSTTSAAQPFLLQQVNNQLVHDFLSQQNNRLFLLFLSLWIYLWLAETSPRAVNKKAVTYDKWCGNFECGPRGSPFSIPSYLYKDLDKHVLRNSSRFR